MGIIAGLVIAALGVFADVKDAEVKAPIELVMPASVENEIAEYWAKGQQKLDGNVGPARFSVRDIEDMRRASKAKVSKKYRLAQVRS